MAKVGKQLPLFTTESRLIDILERELERAHRNEDFYRGKVERLELAAFTHGNPVAKEYVSRTDEKPITEVPVQAESEKVPWKILRQRWEKMTPEEQDKAMQGAN